MTAVDAAAAHAELSPEATRSRLLQWQNPMASAAAGARMAGSEYIGAITAGEIPPPPMAVLMRMSPVAWSDGRATFEGEPGEEHFNPIGAVHGGYVATILDSAMGCAVHTTLPAGTGYTTVGLEVKFVRPITAETGRVRAEAEVIHRGRTQATAEGTVVEAASGRLLAHGTTTCLILGESRGA